MKNIESMVICAVICLLAACGGGGGNPGTKSTNSGSTGGNTSSTASTSAGNSPTGTPAVPALKMALVDASKSPVSDNTILRGASFFVRATLLDANGAPLPNVLVKFTADAATASLTSPSTLTDSSGVAEVAIQSASLKAVAGSVTASSTIGNQIIASSIDIQTKSAVITLQALSFPTLRTPVTLAANQTKEVLVTVSVDGNPAPSALINANFSTTCGQFSSARVATNSSGEIRTNYTAGSNCSTATVTATLVEVAGESKSIDLAIVRATSSAITFVGATTPTMVTSRIPGASSYSTLTFKLVDSANNPIAYQNISATLANESILAGIRFDGGGTTLTTNTDGSGLASVGVKAGAVPGPVTVRVTDVGNPGVVGVSTGVSVSSGKAVQDRLSLASDKTSLEAYSTLGVTANLTFIVSDRFGNPVPAGTTVNFATNSGVITGSSGATCNLDSSSQCSVTYRSISGNSLPLNGHVFVIAWMSGEEAFVDSNGDGIWQTSEVFLPLGTPFLDSDWNGSRGTSEQIIGSSPTPGNSVCPASAYPSVANTCDTSKWRDDVTVRSYVYLVMATSEAHITQLGARSREGFWVWISDANQDASLAFSNTQRVVGSVFGGLAAAPTDTLADLLTRAGYQPLPTLYKNSLPSGSTISAAVETSQAKCTVKGLGLNAIPANVTDGVLVYVRLGDEDDCDTVRVAVTVKSPRGISTTQVF
jgi:ribosomal protein L11